MTSVKGEPHKIFDYNRVDFTQADIKKIPLHHLRFIGQSSLAANDISLFLRTLVGHSHQEGAGTILEELAALTRIILERQLQAKIVEFIKLTDDYRKLCNRKKDNVLGDLLLEIPLCLDKIRNDKYFEISKNVRNIITNHYAYVDWYAGAEAYGPDYIFKAYIHNMNGNTFYPFAEEISYLSILPIDGSGNIDFDGMQSWLSSANRSLISLQRKILGTLFSTYIDKFELKTEKVSVPERLLFDGETRLPLLSY